MIIISLWTIVWLVVGLVIVVNVVYFISEMNSNAKERERRAHAQWLATAKEREGHKTLGDEYWEWKRAQPRKWWHL